MDFKKWLELQEVSTSTGDIAAFHGRWGPCMNRGDCDNSDCDNVDDLVRRQFPDLITFKTHFNKKRKRKGD